MHNLRGKLKVKNRRTAVVLATIIGLLAISGLAMASSQSGEKDDGVLNFAADSGPDGDFLFWNITSLEFGDDDFNTLNESCALEGQGPFQYTWDGEVLQLDGYIEDGTCGAFQGGDVTADGHPLNHGAFMSAFNSWYEGPGRGCIVRHLAQSDLGKTTDTTAGEIDFESAAIDCQHGNGSVDHPTQNDPNTSAPGRARWGEDKPGRSGEAPGHDK